MVQPSPPPDPRIELTGILAGTIRLRQDYEAGFQRYKGNSAFGQALGALGVEAVYDRFGIPRTVSRNVLRGFLSGWEASLEYQQVRNRYDDQMRQVAAFLGNVSESIPSLRRPGNSQRLLARLRPVHEAVRLDTKIRRLESLLGSLQTVSLVYNKDIPPRKPRPTTHQRRVTPAQLRPTHEEALAWAVLGVLLTVFLGLGFGLAPSLGWLASLTLGAVAAGGLTVTRKYWAPWLAMMGRHKR